MINRASTYRLAAGVSLLSFSTLLLFMHAHAVRSMREMGLPAAVELPELERRIRILKEQNETAELQAALASGSAEEMVEVYALPSGTGAVRALAALDTLFSVLQKDRSLAHVSPVTVGALREEGETTILPLSFTATVTREGWKKMVLFTDVSGLLTVGDTLGQEQFDTLLAFTEQENPATIAALEQFFSVDLLRYAESPRSYNEALLKSFSTDAAHQSVRAFIDGPTLQSVRNLLGPMASILRANRLWPVQFLQMQQVRQQVREDGMLDVAVTVEAYGRTK